MQKAFFFWMMVWMGAALPAVCQDDAAVFRQIYSEALKSTEAYRHLEFLTTKIGPRLSGSPQAAAAVEFTRQVMTDYGFDRVYLQEVMVPYWVRGQQEIARIVNSKKMGTVELTICALGNSVGTGPQGVVAEVVEVHSFGQLDSLGEAGVKGKIVFFNRPMDVTLIETFAAYGGAASQRANGPSAAAKYGAVGAIVRSLTTEIDDYPHTGSLVYALNVPKIPAVAVSTLDAELLSKLLKDDASLQVYFETHCEMRPDVLSYNVIGEIKGTEKPEEIIVVGGHLDSWDLAQGAHDDGTGCVQSIEVLRIFKALGIKPKRTIRAVMFMNEENGLRGGRKYAEEAERLKEKHLAAIESDAGGFTPIGFSIDAEDKTIAKFEKWKPLFAPYQLHEIEKGGGGADISPLKPQGVPLVGFRPDSQRYFDYHHTPIDTFDKVNRRELQLGAAAMTALVYLLDRYGL